MSFFVIALFWFAHQVLICNNHFYVDSAEILPFSVSTNATKLFVGETFTMKCEMPARYKYDNNLFQMSFDTDNHGYFAWYDIPGKINYIDRFKIYWVIFFSYNCCAKRKKVYSIFQHSWLQRIFFNTTAQHWQYRQLWNWHNYFTNSF